MVVGMNIVPEAVEAAAALEVTGVQVVEDKTAQAVGVALVDLEVTEEAVGVVMNTPLPIVMDKMEVEVQAAAVVLTLEQAATVGLVLSLTGTSWRTLYEICNLRKWRNPKLY